MQKNIIFGISMLLFCLAAWGVYKYFKPHQNSASENPVATISASALYNEFHDTEELANKKWVGKVIEVTGRIVSVQETGNYISINLDAAKEGGVNGSFLKKDLRLENKINPGDSVTIKGKCTGFLMDVNLVDCVKIK